MQDTLRAHISHIQCRVTPLSTHTYSHNKFVYRLIAMGVYIQGDHSLLIWGYKYYTSETSNHVTIIICDIM